MSRPSCVEPQARFSGQEMDAAYQQLAAHGMVTASSRPGGHPQLSDRVINSLQVFIFILGLTCTCDRICVLHSQIHVYTGTTGACSVHEMLWSPADVLCWASPLSA